LSRDYMRRLYFSFTTHREFPRRFVAVTLAQTERTFFLRCCRIRTARMEQCWMISPLGSSFIEFIE
jgi:hypothetical protein